MTSSLRLDIVLRIPIAVVDDDSVGSCEVDPLSSCAGAKQENVAILPAAREPVNRGLTLTAPYIAINAFVLPAAVV